MNNKILWLHCARDIHGETFVSVHRHNNKRIYFNVSDTSAGRLAWAVFESDDFGVHPSVAAVGFSAYRKNSDWIRS